MVNNGLGTLIPRPVHGHHLLSPDAAADGGEVFRINTSRELDSTDLEYDASPHTPHDADDSSTTAAPTDMRPGREGIFVVPSSPSLLRRALGKQELPDVAPYLVLEPLDTNFERPAAEGWTEYEHPQGYIYAVQDDTRIITTADIHDPHIRLELTGCYERIKRTARRNEVNFPEHADLVIDHVRHEHMQWGYYFVDMTCRCLFWVEKFDANDLLYDMKGPVEKCYFSRFHFKSISEPQSQLISTFLLGHYMTSEYWGHRHRFPGLYDVELEVVQELYSILLYTHAASEFLNLSRIPRKSAIACSSEWSRRYSSIHQRGACGCGRPRHPRKRRNVAY